MSNLSVNEAQHQLQQLISHLPIFIPDQHSNAILLSKEDCAIQ